MTAPDDKIWWVLQRSHQLKISLSHHPLSPRLKLLTHYNVQKRSVKILANRETEEGHAKIVSSLVDYSLVRSQVSRQSAIFMVTPQGHSI
jgi:hypothetical protein